MHAQTRASATVQCTLKLARSAGNAVRERRCALNALERLNAYAEAARDAFVDVAKPACSRGTQLCCLWQIRAVLATAAT